MAPRIRAGDQRGGVRASSASTAKSCSAAHQGCSDDDVIELANGCICSPWRRLLADDRNRSSAAHSRRTHRHRDLGPRRYQSRWSRPFAWPEVRRTRHRRRRDRRGRRRRGRRRALSGRSRGDRRTEGGRPSLEHETRWRGVCRSASLRRPRGAQQDRSNRRRDTDVLRRDIAAQIPAPAPSCCRRASAPSICKRFLGLGAAPKTISPAGPPMRPSKANTITMISRASR